MSEGFGGGAMAGEAMNERFHTDWATAVGGAALCAEFSAGNDGGGMFRSSSSSELSCSASAKVGIGTSFRALLRTAFGVVGEEVMDEDTSCAEPSSRLSFRSRGSP